MKALALLLLLACAGRAAAFGKPEYELELDPYYTDVAVTVPFSSAAVTGEEVVGEFDTYRAMLRRALLPRFAVLEASVNPLPVGGVVLRGIDDGYYRRMKVTPSLNLVEALTAGFEEPYALSLFLGNVTDFSHGEKNSGHKHKGYMGYLVSYGNYHIMESRFYSDNWIESEVKVKGDLVTAARKMSWSFRVGDKDHSNRDITDAFYFGLRRDRIDYVKTPLSWLLSAGIDYRADFRQGDLKPLGHYVMTEKNLPVTVRGKTLALSLGLGFQWLSREKYLGRLAERRLRPETRIMIRPNLKF